jgi:ATP-binding protein involved in chromosome partitioning
LAEGKIAMHFGHCEQFALVDVDPASKKATGTVMETPPPHEPGVLPKWLAGKSANVIIAGGMGMHAPTLLAEQNIRIVVGASAETPENIFADYLSGSLVSGANMCDH